MAPPVTTSRPGRLLAALAALIVVLVIGVLGGTLFQPSHWDSRFRVGKGLDISSGTTITLKAVVPPNTSSAQLQTDLNTAQTIMNSRVNGAGFNGASVTTQSPDLINVSVPGKGVKEVENLVGTTAQLRFRQVLQNFAFTLGLTTVIDVIVVFLFTKPMITLLARTTFYGGQHKWSGLDPARLGMRSPWRGSRNPAPRVSAPGS